MTTAITTSRQRRLSRSRSARHLHRWRGWVALASVAAAAGGLLLLASGARSPDAVGRAAPPFTLPSTDGGMVSLDDFRGRDVLLYFNEGVGCDVCFDQLAQIERAGVLDGSGVTVVPIVVNDIGAVRGQLERFGIRTPYLVDLEKETSRAYETLGMGHHADLPGHSFVLVDGQGRVTWRGDYPGMWVEPDELARAVDAAR